MQNYQLLEEGVQIVLVGSFNPAIFHPQWFARKTLMSDTEADAANLEVCHSDVAKFSTDWYELEVLQKRMTVKTKHIGRSEELRDFVASTFLVLSETPVEAVGFNKQSIYRANSDKYWHLIGDVLAPKAIWEDALPAAQLGMRSLDIQGVRTDDLLGVRNVKVFPVYDQGSKNSDVAFTFNSHIEVSKSIEEERVKDLYQIFMGFFESEMNLASNVFSSVLERVENAGNNV